MGADELGAAPTTSTTVNAEAAADTPAVPSDGDDTADHTVDQPTTPTEALNDVSATSLPESEQGWQITPETSPVSAPRPDEPDQAIADIVDKMESTSVSSSSGQPSEVLNAVEPLDEKPTAVEVIDLRKGSHLNEIGEQISFDQAASLACSDVEVALTSLDEGLISDAVEGIRSAADWTERSSARTIGQWNAHLSDAADHIEIEGPSDFAPLLAFISTCTQGGYEL